MATFSPKRMIALRELAGLSRRELGERINISETSVYRFEHGMNEPYVRTLGAIAYALRCSVADLFDGDWASVGDIEP